MSKSFKRLAIATMMIAMMSAPSAASAFVRGMSGVPGTSGAAPSSLVASIPPAPSSSQGFQWGDAGLGAAGVIVLLGAGVGAANVVRHRRAHRPITG